MEQKEPTHEQLMIQSLGMQVAEKSVALADAVAKIAQLEKDLQICKGIMEQQQSAIDDMAVALREEVSNGERSVRADGPTVGEGGGPNPAKGAKEHGTGQGDDGGDSSG